MGGRAFRAGLRHVGMASDGASRRDLRRRFFGGVDRHRAHDRHVSQLEDRRRPSAPVFAGVRRRDHHSGFHLQPFPRQDRNFAHGRGGHHSGVLHFLHGIGLCRRRQAFHFHVRRSRDAFGLRRDGYGLSALSLGRRARGRFLYAARRIYGGMLDGCHSGIAHVLRDRPHSCGGRLQRRRIRFDRRSAQ